jgi:hypothetical protein
MAGGMKKLKTGIFIAVYKMLWRECTMMIFGNYYQSTSLLSLLRMQFVRII